MAAWLQHKRLEQTLSVCPAPSSDTQDRQADHPDVDLAGPEGRLVRTLMAAVQAMDMHTGMHSLRVARIVEELARRMGLPHDLRRTLRAAAWLHDIGKIVVPDAILNKPGPLSPGEFALVRRHPETGADMLRKAALLADTIPLILHHHERYDGSGYPHGLHGERIPLGARVLATADAVDAMLSPRCYQGPQTPEQVRRELIVGLGRQFDPVVASVTLEWLDDAGSFLTVRGACPSSFERPAR